MDSGSVLLYFLLKFFSSPVYFFRFRPRIEKRICNFHLQEFKLSFYNLLHLLYMLMDFLLASFSLALVVIFLEGEEYNFMVFQGFTTYRGFLIRFNFYHLKELLREFECSITEIEKILLFQNRNYYMIKDHVHNSIIKNCNSQQPHIVKTN